MGTHSKESFRTPWDTILGSKANVRVLRVLERDREPMTVRELSRRASEHLLSVQNAVSRLLDSGLVLRVGTGSRHLVGWNEAHPLADPLASAFLAERERHHRVVDTLARLARDRVGDARFVWMKEHPEEGGPRLEVGLVADSSRVDRLVEELRSAVASVIREEGLLIEVQGRTPADLQLLGAAPFASSAEALHLWGTPPDDGEPTVPPDDTPGRSHQQIDDELLEKAVRLASIIRSRPELIRLAREEIARELQRAGPQQAQTLREWTQVLDSMDAAKLAQWIVREGEQAVRLRQSMPLVFVQAVAADTDASRRRQS